MITEARHILLDLLLLRVSALTKPNERCMLFLMAPLSFHED